MNANSVINFCDIVSLQKEFLAHNQQEMKISASTEVFAFKSNSEIEAILNIFDLKIESATNQNRLQIAHRNKLFFLIGINIGIRAGDLCSLKWSYFLNEDLTWKDNYELIPKKTVRHKKRVRLFFNDSIKLAINNYISLYPIAMIDDYIFKSRKGGSVEPTSLWRIIKETAVEAGIKQNIGTHSLRKTWGFWAYHSAKNQDKSAVLVILQKCFGHSSTTDTLKYIGILDEEIKAVYDSVNLGLNQKEVTL